MNEHEEIEHLLQQGMTIAEINIMFTTRELIGGEQPNNQLQADKSLFIFRLVKARSHKGLSQRQLAAKLNMQQPALARIESGKGNPSLKTLLKIAKALDVSLMLQ